MKKKVMEEKREVVDQVFCKGFDQLYNGETMQKEHARSNLYSTDNQYNKVMTRIHGIAVHVQTCDHLIDWEGT